MSANRTGSRRKREEEENLESKHSEDKTPLKSRKNRNCFELSGYGKLSSPLPENQTLEFLMHCQPEDHLGNKTEIKDVYFSRKKENFLSKALIAKKNIRFRKQKIDIISSYPGLYLDEKEYNDLYNCFSQSDDPNFKKIANQLYRYAFQTETKGVMIPMMIVNGKDIDIREEFAVCASIFINEPGVRYTENGVRYNVEANAKFEVTSDEEIQLIPTRNIEIGEEITTCYGPDYDRDYDTICNKKGNF